MGGTASIERVLATGPVSGVRVVGALVGSNDSGSGTTSIRNARATGMGTAATSDKLIGVSRIGNGTDIISNISAKPSGPFAGGALLRPSSDAGPAQAMPAAAVPAQAMPAAVAAPVPMDHAGAHGNARKRAAEDALPDAPSALRPKLEAGSAQAMPDERLAQALLGLRR